MSTLMIAAKGQYEHGMSSQQGKGLQKLGETFTFLAGN